MLFLATLITAFILLGAKSLTSPVEIHPHIQIAKGHEIDGTRMLRARKRDLGFHTRDELVAFMPRSSLEMDYADGMAL